MKFRVGDRIRIKGKVAPLGGMQTFDGDLGTIFSLNEESTKYPYDVLRDIDNKYLNEKQVPEDRKIDYTIPMSEDELEVFKRKIIIFRR